MTAVAQTGDGRSALRDAGLTPAPEPLTELSFQDPRQLPRELGDREAWLRLPFVVRNGTGQAREYAWTVRVGPEGAARAVASGVARAGAGGVARVRPRVPVACAGPRARVEVAVAEPPRTIAFRAACR